MIAERPDWCVSRQRFWGVPIIVFYCEACSKRLEDFKALRNVVKWFEKEGADAWYKHTPEELLPAGTKCSCGATKWRKENDILDVWFDSGSSHLAVLKGPEWPADVYLEGPDQYRGWFHSSLLIGIGIHNNPPYKGVVTHGWTLDEKGQPMSKSLGNTLYPAEICERWGADLLRLWVASVEYQADVKMSERVMTQLSDAYRKIRNTFRYGLGNLADFDPSRDALPNDQLDEMDRWMLERTADLVKKCRDWYSNYEFHRVYHAIHDFCVVDLSSFYYDVLKDRLYTKAANNKSRRSAQTAVWKISSALVRLAAPILVFTAEEIWKYLPKAAEEPESVHMTFFSEDAELRTNIASKASRQLGTAREGPRRSLESARSRPQRKENQRRPRSQGVAQRPARAQSQAEGISAAAAPGPVHRVAGRFSQRGNRRLSLRRNPRPRSHHSKGRRRKSASAAGTIHVHVGENKRYPTICERCSEALAEIEAADSEKVQRRNG